MRMFATLSIMLSLAMFGFPAFADQDHRHVAGDPDQLGSVEFVNSCSAEVQPEFERAVAMLHSFWYDEAGRRFREVAEADPECAIAWWGVAMSHWQPLWEPRGPSPEAFRKGLAAIARARGLGGGSRYERDFIAALEKLYTDADAIDHRDRVLAYEKAMEALHAAHPDNAEARVFYALSLLASATSLPPDKTYSRQKKAGELLMEVFRSRPDHPGTAHYIIHAYDYPALASRALEAARRYAKIAPDSPHAQHMPSHIFTRLGLWDESIASNRNVIRVARAHDTVGEELHATDYLVFAHLQQGEDAEALRIINEMPKPPRPGELQYFAGIYAHAAIPARYAVERRQWREAAGLTRPAELPGGRYAWADAAIHFARALGAARTGDVDRARSDLAALTAARRTLEELKEDYWAMQVEIQRRAAGAWLVFAKGEHDRALELMRAAAALEDTTDKHPVTPGQIVPARDLLGQMLLELDRPAEALAEFESVLDKEPGRFGALYGAARSAELAGRADSARQRYRELLDLAPDSRRDELHHARGYLERSSATQEQVNRRPHADAGNKDVLATLVDGTGTYSRPIESTSPRAQAFFDQGLRLVWGYYFPEAAASFQEAARLDPDNPMIQWGLALAISPNPNSRYQGFPDDPAGEGREAIAAALSLASDASDKHRAFIDALHVRYDDDAIPDREARDQAYLEAARALARRYPDDPDAVSLYADAAMTVTPWRYWDAGGNAVTEDIRSAVTMLEESMERRPDHPGTNHLYIHIVESSLWPERALPQADRLESLMPGAGHIVHMPSHIYVRTGRYRQAIESNRRSLAADQRFLAAWGDRALPMAITSHKLSAAVHSWHAHDFIRYSASVQGNYQQALEAARTAVAIAVRDHGPEHGRSQLAVAAIWLIHRMFGEWDAVLSEPAPPGQAAYRDAAIAYARGSAYAAQGDLEAAEKELARVRAAAAALEGIKIPGMANMPDDLLAIARTGLEGEIAWARGETEHAIAAFERAVELQDRLRYIEPPDWPLSMRIYLGRALLKDHRYARAEQVLREDLEWHQSNGWALHGLHAALEAQGMHAEAAGVRRRFEQSWRDSDINLAPLRP